VTSGGRVDLEVVPAAAGAVRVEIGGSAALLVGPPGAAAPAASRQPAAVLDLLHYGTPAPLGFDPATESKNYSKTSERGAISLATLFIAASTDMPA